MAVPTKSWKPLEVLRFAAGKERGEKAPFHCMGKSSRERCASLHWKKLEKESCASLFGTKRKRELRRTGEERATPGGCECHRETGSARWHSQPPKLRMPPRDWLRPVAANATERLHKKLEICCCDNFFLWTCVPKPRPSLWVEVDFHLVRGFLEVDHFESRIPRS